MIMRMITDMTTPKSLRHSVMMKKRMIFTTSLNPALDIMRARIRNSSKLNAMIEPSFLMGQ